MNNKDLLKAIGDIDDKYLINETDEKVEDRTKNNIMKNIILKRRLKYVLASVCIVLISGIVINQSKLFEKKITPDSGEDRWKVKEIYRDKDEFKPAIATRPKWEDMTIAQKFFSIEYLDKEYYTSRETEISSDKIGEKIETKTITQYEETIEEYYSADVTFYKIIDFSQEAVMAVQFNDEPHYYVYTNSKYQPKTLGDFIKDFNLKDTISFGTITYEDIYTDSKGEIKKQEVEFYNVDNSVIWEMLFNNLNAENVYNENGHTKANMNGRMSINVEIPLLGIKNKEIFLGEKGYLFSHILITNNGFDIGEETVQRFMDYVVNNYDGYKIVYVDKENKRDTVNENDLPKEKIMVTENTVNGFITKEYEINNNTNTVYKLEPYTP